MTEAAWFTITCHFALHGCENQEHLHHQDLLSKRDERGQEYIELATAFLTSNHHSISSWEKVKDGRIHQLAQVATTKFLLEKMGPTSRRIFQMASDGAKADRPWFSGLPLERNTIKGMMKRIASPTALSQEYTNHCVRAIAIQILVDTCVPETAIIGTIGQKQVQSLTACATRNSNARRSPIASILGMEKPPQPQPAPTLPPSRQPQTMPLRLRQPTQPMLEDDDIDDFIATCDMDALCAQPAHSFQPRVPT